MAAVCKWASVCLWWLAFFGPTPLWALDPSRSLAQLHHTAWTVEAGAPPDIWALAQTPDGFLWLGTGAGLYRFDGDRFEKYQASGDVIPTVNINSLFAAASGDLWIGYADGHIAILKDGRLEDRSKGVSGFSVIEIAQDREKAIWAIAVNDDGAALTRYSRGRWQTVGPEWGLPPDAAYNLLAARDGAVWVTTDRMLYLLRRGARRFQPTGQHVLPRTYLTQAPNGGIWFSTPDGGAQPLPDLENGARPIPVTVRTRSDQRTVSPGRIIFDRDGNVWGTGIGGVIRFNPSERRSTKVHNIVDRFSLRNGLTSDIVVPILEDREGNLWVGTNLGLDRFRAANAVAAPGIPVTSLAGYHVANGGDGVYVASGDTLYRAHPNRPADALAHLSTAPNMLYADRSGAIWVGTDKGLERFTGRKLERSHLPWAIRGAIWSETQDRGGASWIVVNGRELFRQVRGGWRHVSVPLAPGSDLVRQVLADAENRIWLTWGARLIMIDGARIRSFSERDGLSVGRIEIIATGADELLVGGDFGLSRFDGRRFRTLRSEQHPLLLRISGILQSMRGDTWINGISGVVRVSTLDLDAAFEDPARGLHYKLFDLGDGLPGVAQQDGDEPTVVEDAVGRVWFVTSHGVAWIDPARLARNSLPPPITIRSLTVNGREYPFQAKLNLPAGSENVQIDYTALSLAAPERVHFRYRLEEVDRAWVDPGLRRQAFYTKLAPGLYHFHIIAANNDGVWNLEGANLSFRILPRFTQSVWFTMLCGLLFVAMLWLIYLSRLRQATVRIQGRLEARLTERERIARELHDTLLQGFQGLVLRFQAVAESIPTTNVAHQRMERALVQAEQILIDGRDRIRDLRPIEGPTDLSETFVAAGERLHLKAEVNFRVIIEGRPRTLHPVVLDEISRIGDEALFNALQHARARSIDVVVVYHPRELRVLFRDDGVGIDQETLAAGGKADHFGLMGMRERTERIQGKMFIASRRGAGTEVGITIPALAAYIGGSRTWWFSRYRVDQTK